ncbi:hypothetical protein ABW19_dt0206315 [Dactylella cylindrospora]|nr:hypothetical protein ABW19_dt0206315 [Dactylella cylindrospora]
MVSLQKIRTLQKAAFVTHGIQAVMVFVLWIICLVLKAQKGGSPSQVNVLFAMIIWFAGFVALAVHNNEGISKGETDGEKTCATTAYGTPSICEISKAAIGVGAVVFILFAITTGMYAYTCYFLWKQNIPFTSHLKPEVISHDVEATTQDAFSHKDDQNMLDPEDDERDPAQYHASKTPPPAQGPGVYAPLSGTAVGQGRWQGEDDDDDIDFRRDSRDRYRNQNNASVSDQGGRMTPLTGIQDPYTDRVQQPVEFPDGPYNTGYRY